MTRVLRKAESRRDSKAPFSFSEQSLHRTLELVFYAHMEMADLANQVLALHKLGRAHHRVLYFVVQQPGITVNELISILRITNQALSRTINQLAQMQLIEQKPGQQDRRHRCNFPTPKGIALCRQLTRLQYQHIDRSLAGVPREDLKVFWDVLLRMVREKDRAWITTSDQLK
ncbi:MarR family winged helix-turn-helix transcriptional regulator [Rhodopseudomonas palustris]|uniref:MarR family transcriptional regulator n=1 Tax=Rhodopseudomonas palustris TaxID=1076 RepID=A0A418V1K9_RHOPL|nr:MarR family transcriptional regulator [Rhodopseudomonas palustris]RJF69761.1 MarR family transcriptional regulator [Rhodopseudomonas palustris]